MARARTAAGAWLRHGPWIFILAAIAAVQVVRGQVFDAVLFGLGAVVLIVDALEVLPRARRRPRIPVVAFIVAAVAVALVIVLAPRHGIAVGVTLGVVALVAIPYAWLTPPQGAADSDHRRVRVRRAAIGWASVAVAMCLVELWSFLVGRISVEAQAQYPAISELLDPALDSPIARAVFAVVWLATGYLLLTRGRSVHDA